MLTAIPQISADEPDLSSEYLRKFGEIIRRFRVQHPEIQAIAKAIESMSITDSLDEAVRISRMKDVEPWLKNLIAMMATGMAVIDFESGERRFSND